MRCETQVALLALISNGLVGDYMIHANPPYVSAVEPNLDTIERYWFAVTERGEKFLQADREPVRELINM